MKQCPRCRRLNRPEYRFCAGCGQALPDGQERKKQAQKKRAGRVVGTLLGACLIMAIGAGGTLWLAPNFMPSDADTATKSGSLSLQKADDDSVIDAMDEQERELKAKLETDPQNVQTYADLYAFYIEEDRLEEADFVGFQAIDNLPDFEDVEEYRAAEYAIDQAAHLYETDEGKFRFTIARELEGVDEVPFGLGESMWLIHQNGKYSFIDPQGNRISDHEGKRAMIVSNSPADNDNEIYACIDDGDFTGVSGADQYPADLGWNPCIGFGGGRKPYTVEVNEKGNIAVRDNCNEGKERPDLPDVPYLLDDASHPGGSRYVYNPESYDLYGPYEKGDPACLGQMVNPGDQADPTVITHSLDSFSNLAAASPARIRTEDGYFLVSKDGSDDLAFEFDDAFLIDTDSIGANYCGKTEVYDENLDLLYRGPFELAARPIGQTAPVCMDGKWFLIDLSGSDEPENPDPEASADASSTKEEPEPKDLHIDFPADAAGEYGYTCGHGNTMKGMSVAPDGSFTFYRIMENDGSHPECEWNSRLHTTLSGHLEAVQKADGRLRFRVADVRHDQPIGYLRTESSGRIDYEVDLPYFAPGSEFDYYPAGTACSALDERTRNELAYNYFLDGSFAIETGVLHPVDTDEAYGR